MRKSSNTNVTSMVLLNLDGFKAYNKTHGYLSGDKSLVRLAKTLKREAQHSGEFLARFGGNEFALLLPGTSTQKAVEIGTQFRHLIADAQIDNRASKNERIITASMGVHTVAAYSETSKYGLIDGAYQDLARRRNR